MPLLFFALYSLASSWDIPGWLLGWYYRGLFHYYIVYLVSFMALIASLSDRATLNQERGARALLITLGFSAMAAFSLLSSLALPGVLMPDTTNPAFSWSSRLALPGSGLFFALAGVRWTAGMASRLAAGKPLFWIVLLYAVCAAIVLGASPSLDRLHARFPHFYDASAVLSVLLLLWAAAGSWKRYRRKSSRFEKSLALAMTLLAEAQIFQAMPGNDEVSWWLYQSLVLAALAVVLRMRLISFEESHDFRPSRYFFTLGSTLILGLSLLSGELGTHLFEAGSSRLSMVSLAMVQGATAFLLLYFVVRHLDHQFEQRIATLESEQDLRTELTQMIVHDLKSPLTVLKGGIEMLERGSLGPLTEEQVGALKLVNQSSQKVSNLIQDMLDVRRLEEGVLRPNPVGFNPRRLLQEAAENVSVLTERNQLNFALSLPDTLPEIHGDPELLGRVVHNLLANAVRFAPQGGEIGLSADVDDAILALRVADNGAGVPKPYRECIFETQGPTKGMTRRGRGMSLAFCRMVCEAHGGTLTVDDNPGGGALFKVTIPISGSGPAAKNATQR